jgi:hypothetical protein
MAGFTPLSAAMVGGMVLHDVWQNARLSIRRDESLAASADG